SMPPDYLRAGNAPRNHAHAPTASNISNTNAEVPNAIGLGARTFLLAASRYGHEHGFITYGRFLRGAAGDPAREVGSRGRGTNNQQGGQNEAEDFSPRD